MSVTSPVRTSSQTSKLSRPPLLTIQPTLQRPFGAQVSRASCNRSGNAKQRSEPTQTRASAFAIAAAISASVSSAAGIAHGVACVLVVRQATGPIAHRTDHALPRRVRGVPAAVTVGAVDRWHPSPLLLHPLPLIRRHQRRHPNAR